MPVYGCYTPCPLSVPTFHKPPLPPLPCIHCTECYINSYWWEIDQSASEHRTVSMVKVDIWKHSTKFVINFHIIQILFSHFFIVLTTAIHFSSCSPQRFPRELQSGTGNPYNFAYQVEDSSEGLNYLAKQSSDGKVVQGEYSVRLPGGRRDRTLKR